jgi:hypothetical protein
MDEEVRQLGRSKWKKTCIDVGLSHKKIEDLNEDYGCEQSDFVLGTLEN